MTQPVWRIRLSTEAERDFLRILRYTAETFGDRQSVLYRATLLEALGALDAGPEALGSIARDELLPGLRSLHVTRKRRRGRHFILYRAAGEDIIEVVRILHDAMDFTHHLPTGAR